MAGLSMDDFERQLREVCSKSPIVKNVALFSATKKSKLWRVILKDDSNVEIDVAFIDAYYSAIVGKTTFAHIQNKQRVFGADNAGGRWHWHPYEDPQRHDFINGEISFAEFLKRVEEKITMDKA